MGSRTTIPVAVLTLLIGTGCGHLAGPSPTQQTPTVPAPSPTRSLTVPPTDTAAAPPYRTATREVTELAASFVLMVVAYDTTQEGKLVFLQRVRELATPAELGRLAHSPRARLPWPVLRARAERTDLEVTGVTVQPGPADHLRVIVETTLTTHTTFATVTGFRGFTLTLVPADDTWLVDRAEGLDP